ncbi:tRNA (adenosine(37)-N6)-threonylcarbamoyltransferase complex ATPase subunit type 1 TsaE [Mycoplasmatota bacterium]|jgi:tRNA threonylcarbamoyladenosine biosynthesis protein TsaE|nr:tRNA (adenosine(37)-N6)-threonylcarbamoyltransferase complex ATPase subunit type 1 TsaE [Mycoplasmatota bacterium]
MKVKQTNTVEETKFLGYELGLLLKDEPHIVILLDGDLGAGKTTFTQGLADGLGIKQIVNSPTYTIMKKYATPDRFRFLYHLDLYRLQEAGSDFDLEEYIDGMGMVVIEWPFQVKEFMPQDHLRVGIKKLSETGREFTIECHGYPCKRAIESI